MIKIKIILLFTIFIIFVVKGHTDEINQAEFSINGQYILTAGEDATAKLWKIDGSLIKSFGENNKVEYTSAPFSKDGKFAIVSSKNTEIDFWYLPLENGNYQMG